MISLNGVDEFMMHFRRVGPGGGRTARVRKMQRAIGADIP